MSDIDIDVSNISISLSLYMPSIPRCYLSTSIDLSSLVASAVTIFIMMSVTIVITREIRIIASPCVDCHWCRIVRLAQLYDTVPFDMKRYRHDRRRDVCVYESITVARVVIVGVLLLGDLTDDARAISC